ncbi:hypothetical protein K439DRAFT_1660132 [Ramaria rubella]|nr:hypothetical protein K439DRAFT_1660132 [Ramaria rubella]
MATPATDITLSSLLPSPYVFIYSLPLLIAALVLTFAGAFLTLDRTRTFPPQAPVEAIPGHYGLDGEKSKIKAWWVLEGGMGGLAGGWTFGTYLATFLCLLIPNRTSDTPLSSVQFLIVQVIVSLLFTFFAGRFKYAALGCIGMAGGVSFALIVAVVLHPGLLTRLIFVAILIPLFTIATLLPISRTQHVSVRIAAASAGSFGVIVSIALLAHIPSWANVWERLWMSVSLTNEWGTNIERGLSAAACIMLAIGVGSDWLLRKQFGENPDQKWDAYLAQYATNLPNANHRAGSFQPIFSWWQRIFYQTPANPILFPSDSDLKPSRLPVTYNDAKPITKLPRKRSDVKFQPLDGYSDSDSDSEPEWGRQDALQSYSLPQKPWIKKEFVSSTTLSGVTLYDSDDDNSKEKTDNKRVSTTKAASIENYSDSEGEDITTPHSTPLKRSPSSKSHRDEPGWKPDFLLRHDSESTTNNSSVTAVSHNPPGAVPMTPSLIRAIDRIAVAQGEAYGCTSPPPLSPPLPRAESEERWRGFWDRVHQTAHNASSH